MRTRIAQTAPVLGDVSENATKVESSLYRAQNDDVDLLVFPEMHMSGYNLELADCNSEDLATAAREELIRIAPMTDNITLIVGTPVEHEDGIQNAAAILDDGEWTDTYAKSHLYDTEAETFVPGNELPVFDTSAGILGVMICYDVEFPEVARVLTDKGAEMLVSIWCQMRPFEEYQSAFLRARAMENIRPHVLCNRVGSEGDFDFHGASSIVSASGEALVTAGEDVELEITAEIDSTHQGYETLTYLEDRRPELYTFSQSDTEAS